MAKLNRRQGVVVSFCEMADLTGVFIMIRLVRALESMGCSDDLRQCKDEDSRKLRYPFQQPLFRLRRHASLLQDSMKRRILWRI